MNEVYVTSTTSPRLFFLLLSQVGGVLCLVLNSQLFYDASDCPHLKDAQETWLEEQLSRASSSTVELHQWHHSILVWFMKTLSWFSFAAAIWHNNWIFSLEIGDEPIPHICLCSGAQTQTRPGVPAHPSVPKEPRWGGQLLQPADGSQTKPAGQVQEGR